MDFVLLSAYIVCAIYIRSVAAFVVPLLFVIAWQFTDNMLYHAICAMLYTPVCYFKDSRIKLAGLSIVAFQYVMAWDLAINPTEETLLYNIYPYVIFMLEFLLIFAVYKSGKHGIRNIDINRYNDTKPNSAHLRSLQKRQTP